MVPLPEVVRAKYSGVKCLQFISVEFISFRYIKSNLNLKSTLPFISNIQNYKIQHFSLWFIYEIRQSSKYPYEKEYKWENRKPEWKLI